MKTFNKPKNLNGAELIDELKKEGILVTEIFDFGNNTIGFETDDEIKSSDVVAKHNGTIIAPEPTIEQKLSSVGLTIDDLKVALGL